MATTIKVYDGQSITFYSPSMGKTAEMYLDDNDNLVVDASAGGIFPSGADSGHGAFKVNKLDVGAGGSPGLIVSAIWNGNTIAAIYGGTGQSVFTAGDLLYASSATALSLLSVGASPEGKVLVATAGNIPSWSNTIGKAGNTTTVAGSLTIDQNLTVNGTTTTINTTTLAVSDNIIVLNQDETAAPTVNAGIEVERGTATYNASLLWDETADFWKIGLVGAEIAIVDLSTTQSLTNKTFSSTASAGLSLNPAADGYAIVGGTTPRTLTVTGSNITLTGGGYTLTLGGAFTTAGGGITLTASAATNASFPASGSITLVDLGTAQTFAAAKTITTGGLVLGAAGGGATKNNNITGTGTYAAGTIAVDYGGTGVTSFNTGGLVYGGSTLGSIASVVTGSVLQSNGTSTAPVWSTSLSVSASVTSGTYMSVGSNLTISAAGTASQNGAISGWTGGGWMITGSSFPTTAAKTITAAVKDTPSAGIVKVTATGHGFLTGQSVTISGVVGMTDLNAVHKITDVETDFFYVNLSTIQTYTSGGTATPIAAGIKGTAEFDNLIVRGSMRIYELLIQQIRASNGSIFVSSTAKISSAAQLTLTIGALNSTYTMNTPSGTPHGFAVNDLIRAQRWVGGATVFQIDMQVTAVANVNSFTAQLLVANDYLIGTGINGFNDLEFVRLGNTSTAARQGSIYLTADDSNAPYIDVLSGVTAHNQFGTTAKVKVRMGKLLGIVDATVGLSSNDIYGLYSDSVYLKGNLVVGGTQAIALADNTIAIGNVTGTPTSTNTGIKIAMTGTAASSGIFGYSSGSSLAFALPLSGAASIAGWNFDNRYLYKLASGTPGSTPNDGLFLDSTNSNLVVYDGTNKRLEVGYIASGIYGIKGYTSTSTVLFELSDNQNLIAGWTITSDTLYKLASGTPASSPSNGIVLNASATPTLLIYEGTAKRVELGYLASNIYGIKGYATDGTTVLFELSDNQNKIAGWTIASTSLYNGRSALGNTTLGIYIGTDGIEAGPAGATPYFKATSTGGILAGWTYDLTKLYSGTDILLDAGNKTVSVAAGAVKMYYTGDTDYGIKDSAGKFALGYSNHIAGWYFDTASLWSGNATISNAAVSVVLTQSTTKASAKIAVGGGAGASANTITVGGAVAGIILQGDGQFQARADANNLITMTTSALTIKASTFDLVAGTTPTLAINNTRFAVGAAGALPTGPATGTGVYIDTTGISGTASSVRKFFLDASTGTITATGANITGTITATLGAIGNWTIETNSINARNSSAISFWVSATATPLAAYDTLSTTGVWIGADSKFRVGTYDGSALTKGLVFDATDLTINSTNFKVTSATTTVNGTSVTGGIVWASRGGFGGSIANPSIVLEDAGIGIFDGAVKRVVVQYKSDNSYIVDNYSSRITTGAIAVPDGTFSTALALAAGSLSSSNASWRLEKATTGSGLININTTVAGQLSYTRTGDVLWVQARSISNIATSASAGNPKTYIVNISVKTDGSNYAQTYLQVVDAATYPEPSAGSFNTTTGVIKTYYFPGSNGVLTAYAIPFTTEVANVKIIIGQVQGSSGQGYNFQADNITIDRAEPIVEIGHKGLFAFNSPYSYIKLGAAGFEIKGATLDVGDVIVRGNFITYGQNITVQGTSVNGVTLTPLATGFTAAGGTSSCTLTVDATASISQLQPKDATLTALAGLTISANNIILCTGTDAFSVGQLTNAYVSSSAAIAYSKLNLATSIVNGDINTSAAIAYSKLNLSASIVNADVNSSAAIVYSKLSLSNSIVNADINASASIADTKLATISSTGKVSGSAIAGNISLTASSGTVTATGFLIGTTNLTQIYREEIVVSSGGITQGVAVTVPGSRTYTTTTATSANKMLVYVDGRLQKPGAGFDYTETNSTSITFLYDIAEGATITFIVFPF